MAYKVCPPDCEDRSPTCHATCERYLAYEKKKAEETEAKIRMHAGDYNSYDTMQRNKNAYLGARSNKRRR